MPVRMAAGPPQGPPGGPSMGAAGLHRAQRLPVPPPAARRPAAREPIMEEDEECDAAGELAAGPPGGADVGDGSGAHAAWEIAASGGGGGDGSSLAALLAAVPGAGADWKVDRRRGGNWCSPASR